MEEKKEKQGTENKRTGAQKDSDRLFIAENIVKGYSFGQIAEMLNERNKSLYTLTRQQVHYDYKQIQKEWKEDRDILMDYKLELELKKIEIIEQECWIEWEKSKRNKRKIEIEGGEIAQAQTTQGKLKKRTIEDSTGNVKYLERIQWCIDKRAELFGLKSITITQNSRIDPEQIKQLSNLPPEVLNEIRRHLNK